MKKKKLTTRQEAYKQLKKFLDTMQLESIVIEPRYGELTGGDRYYTGRKKLIFVFGEIIKIKKG